jgi:hypothetical protein
MKLARSKDGAVVHLASCRHARIPWNWADDKPWWTVAEVIDRTPWLRWCQICSPVHEADA